MEAVAAPRPDAEPVTIAHRPSQDIAFPRESFDHFEAAAAVYHTAQGIARKIAPAEFVVAIPQRFIPPLQRPLPTSVLVSGAAFPHHGLQEPKFGQRLSRRVLAKTGNAVAESENIVAQTAERIFADLADAQTINHDKEGHWKAPLWQALSEAGLPLSWVPEDCGGSGASLAEGFGVLGAAGRFALSLPLAETMLAGWLLSQARIASVEGAMTVAPANPRDRISYALNGTLSGRARDIPFASEAEHIAVLAHGSEGPR